MNRLRAGLIGLGVMGSHHARVLSEEFKLVSVLEVRPVRDSGFTIVGTLEEFLAAELDYCVISVPTATHAALFEAVAPHVKGILIEKPIASSTEEALRMISLAQRSSNLAGIGHIERFNPAIQMMRTLVEQQSIGDLLQITTRRQGPYPNRIQDVGVVKDLATHDIDIVQWVTGSTYKDFGAYSLAVNKGVHEDLLSVSGVLNSGILVNHVVNWRFPVKERVVTLVGTRGTLVADLLTSDLTFLENGVEPISWGQLSHLRGNSEGTITKFALNKIEPLRAEHRAMAEYFLTGNSEKIVTLEQGFENLRIAELMLQGK